VERLADHLVGDVGAIEVAGVDMVDAAGDRLAQYGEGGVAILGWAKYAGAGELHGAVTHAVDGAVAEGGGAGGGDVGHGKSPKLCQSAYGCDASAR